MPAPNGSGSKGSAPLGKHPHEKSVFYRFSILLLFVIAAFALMYGVVKFLTAEPISPPAENPAKIQPSAKPLTSLTPPATPQNPAPPIKSLPTPAPAQPTLIEPPPSPPEGIDAKPPAMAALDVLEKFLTAKTLSERLPIIETKTAEAEIAASCLAGALPPTKSTVIEAQETNPTEEVIDFYFNVDFEAENGRTNPQTILLRSRGGSDPKVVADPFLDLYGGRLAAYAAKPTDKSETFQVIANAVASCTDPLIANREKKLTLKLLARDNTKEIAQAYFGKLSKIGEMLNDGTYSLSYGKAKSCTIMLRWNIEDNPQHPYLEAIQIKALDWNP
ncbi:MAG: hypothetical protein H8M99_16210 [Gloeobacteraceae cyanobacterium ES-bin-144]|nr:hypothetical protein [Verrucomicrobiales bacterium]